MWYLGSKDHSAGFNFTWRLNTDNLDEFDASKISEYNTGG
jgi:hypothetical protein